MTTLLLDGSSDLSQVIITELMSEPEIVQIVAVSRNSASELPC